MDHHGDDYDNGSSNGQQFSYRRSDSSSVMNLRRTSSSTAAGPVSPPSQSSAPTSVDEQHQQQRQQEQQQQLRRNLSRTESTRDSHSRRRRRLLILQAVLSLLLLLLYLNFILSKQLATTDIVGGGQQDHELPKTKQQQFRLRPQSTSSSLSSTAIRLSKFRKPFSLRIVQRPALATKGRGTSTDDDAATTTAVIVPIPGASTDFGVIHSIQSEEGGLKWSVPRPNETITVGVDNRKNDGNHQSSSVPTFVTAIEHPCVRLHRAADFMGLSYFFDKARKLDQRFLHRIYPDTTMEGSIIQLDLKDFVHKMNTERGLGWSYKISHPNFLPMHSFITTRATTTPEKVTTMAPRLGVDLILTSGDKTREWVDGIVEKTVRTSNTASSNDNSTTLHRLRSDETSSWRDAIRQNREKSVTTCKQFDHDFCEALEKEYALDYCLFGYTKGPVGVDVPPNPPMSQEEFEERWKQCTTRHPELELQGSTDPQSLMFGDWVLQISRKNNLGFSHIPKTGGTTIEDNSWLMGDKLTKLGGHFGIGLFKYRQSAARRELLPLSLSETNQLQQQQRQQKRNKHPDNIPILFAMVRHPCDRFVSAHTFLLDQISGFINMKGDLLRNNDGTFPASIPSTVEEWVKKMWEEDGPGWSVKQPCNHMSPLTSFLFYELDEWRDYIVEVKDSRNNDDNDHSSSDPARTPSFDGWSFGVDQLFCMDQFDDATSWIDEFTHKNSTWPHKYKTSHGGCAALEDNVREMIEREYVLDYCVFGYETGNPNDNDNNNNRNSTSQSGCISDEIKASGLSIQQFFVDRLKFCMEKHKDIPTAKVLRMNDEFHRWPSENFENFFF